MDSTAHRRCSAVVAAEEVVEVAAEAAEPEEAGQLWAMPLLGKPRGLPPSTARVVGLAKATALATESGGPSRQAIEKAD
jgi:hypothetical protein